MNFLAHAYFADGDAERIVGQFCGDFVRGSDLGAYSIGIQRGIRMHRQIDAFTDRHSAVLGVRPLFIPPLRRLAGVVTDVVYDHCLAIAWAHYSNRDFDLYIDEVTAALLEHKHEVPERMQRFIDFIIKHKVLQANRDFAGVEVTLQRLSARSKVFAPLACGAAVAQDNMEALRASFDEFFPELQTHVNELKLLNDTGRSEAQ
ncbi:MAG: ACP phosphodiesterase [Granulosicoccaceae bacterium]